MIHVIYGKDRFLVLEKRNEIISKFKSIHTDIEQFDFYASDAEFNFGKVAEAVQTVSLFDVPRVVFFFVEDEKHINQIDTDTLQTLVSNPTDVELILAFPKKLTQFKKLHASLRKHAKEHAITKANGFNAPSSLQEGLSRYNVKMTAAAQRLFLERIGEDYGRLASELQKLSLLEMTIDENIIDNMINRDISRDIFSLGNALLDKDRKKAFEIYHSLLEQKNDPLNLAPLVASNLRSIYQVETLYRRGYSEKAILDSLSMSKGQYWVIVNRQMGKVKDILPILNALANLDQKAKLGEIDRFVAFELFMLEVMS